MFKYWRFCIFFKLEFFSSCKETGCGLQMCTSSVLDLVYCFKVNGIVSRHVNEERAFAAAKQSEIYDFLMFCYWGNE